MDANTLKYIDYELEKATKNKISIKFYGQTQVPFNDEETEFCRGYFDEEEVVVATGNGLNEWLPIFVHETSHMDQFIENAECWEACFINKNREDVGGIFDEWISGKRNLTKAKLERITQLVRTMELDCERRAVQKIYKWKLPIDIKYYIQQANVYMYYHNYMKETRKWQGGDKSPSKIEKLWEIAPVNFNNDYDVTPPILQQAFKKYLN